MKPDQLLEKLQEGSSDKVRKTLNVIYSVCKNQLDNGIKTVVGLKFLVISGT